MTRRLFPVILAVSSLAAMTLPAMANSNGALKATIIVTSASKVGTATLAPGQYDVTVDGNQAKFVQHGKTVAEAPCTMKDLSAKAQQTGFQVDHEQITEIEISGKNQAIEFGSSQGN